MASGRPETRFLAKPGFRCTILPHETSFLRETWFRKAGGQPSPPQPIVGVDVGGTFTDFVYFDGGAIRIFKLLSTRADPSRALLDGLAALGVAPEAVISHGTTVATNAVLEHTAPAPR